MTKHSREKALINKAIRQDTIRKHGIQKWNIRILKFDEPKIHHKAAIVFYDKLGTPVNYNLQDVDKFLSTLQAIEIIHKLNSANMLPILDGKDIQNIILPPR